MFHEDVVKLCMCIVNLIVYLHFWEMFCHSCIPLCSEGCRDRLHSHTIPMGSLLLVDQLTVYDLWLYTVEIHWRGNLVINNTIICRNQEQTEDYLEDTTVITHIEIYVSGSSTYIILWKGYHIWWCIHVLCNCNVTSEDTCWFDFLAHLCPESSVHTITVLPFILLVLQSIPEGILSSCSRSNCLPSLPLRLKLTTICEVQSPIAMEPQKENTNVISKLILMKAAGYTPSGLTFRLPWLQHTLYQLGTCILPYHSF